MLQRDQGRVGGSLAWEPPARQARRPPTGVEVVIEVDDDAFDSEVARVGASGWPWAEAPQRRPWGVNDFRVLDPDG
jgi:catechol 2,3-dioxygenase-like lactoylglutathione lyase family enzyme